MYQGSVVLCFGTSYLFFVIEGEKVYVCACVYSVCVMVRDGKRGVKKKGQVIAFPVRFKKSEI